MNTPFRLIGGFMIALTALTQYTSAQAPPINARTIEDRDHITVMELSGGYDRQPESSRAYEIAIRQAIAKELLRQHQDDYDFVVAFSGFPFNLGADDEGTRVGGRYYSIKNDVQGIGLDLFDNSADWGSSGKLQGFIDMGALASLATDPTDPLFEQTLGTLAHEVAHRWSAHLRFQNPDGTPNHSLRGGDGAHWSFFLQSHNSVLYGNDWRDNGNGTLTSIGRSRSFYSPLDLYAMGVLGASEVPPFFLIEGAAGDPSRLPEVGATITGTARPVSIDDVIAVEGERVPHAAAAPKQFKIAFVYLVRPGQSADGGQLRAINNVREAFATRMVILTGGQASVEIFPDTPDAAVTDPGAVLPPSSGPRTAPVDLAQGVSWLLSRQAISGRFADSPSTSVRDTAAAIELLAGAPATFSARQRALAWLSTLTEARNVDTVARRMAAIVPQHAPADSTFLLAAQHPSGGWGLRPGDEPDPFDTTLALAALPTADPSALARLLAAQRADGSWPMQPGGSGSILATAAALGLSGRFTSVPLNDALARASTWLLSRQNTDGGFGESGSTAYETALALLHAARVSSVQVDVRWAVEFLRRGQLADGSWNESVYETAMAIRALQIADLPNVALVASSLAFAPSDPVEGEVVSLSALLANTGSTDLTNVVVRFYDGHPDTGGLPIGEAVVIASLPAQARVPVTVPWNTTDASGAHEIVAIADPALTLDEANEADNLLAGQLTVTPPPEGPDVAIAAADLVLTPDLLRSVPQSQTVNVRVANLGRTAAANVAIALFAGDPATGGARVGETSVAVPARGSAQATLTFSITTPGERRYFAVADPDNALNEADETNNAASRTLAVQSSIDLFVANVTLSENPIALGRDLQIGATVGNSGTADVFAARVRVSIDAPGGPIDVATPTLDLPAGQINTISATWRTTRALADAPVIVHVDPQNAFAETSEANNQASATVSVPSSTDANLRVIHQELAVATPVLQGGVATIQIPVRNTGFADAANVGVGFYVGVPGAGGVQIGATQTIALIAAGGQATASVVWDQITTFGDKLIYAVVDPAGTVTEFDEQDNTAFITVDVLSLPDLAVSSAAIAFTPSFPRNGEPVDISVLVSNLGEQAATTSVQFYLGAPSAGGMPIGSPQALMVEGGAFASAQVHVDALTNGASTIFVVVDAANQVPELDEANNLASRTVGVQDSSSFFTFPYFSPNGDEVQDTTEFFFRTSGGSPDHVQVIDRFGDVVRTLLLDDASLSGDAAWDGRDDEQRIVADGEYMFAVVGGDGSRLASATVVVDNNRSPVGDALGTKYLLQENLTCNATGPVSVARSANPAPPFTVKGWLPNDSGLLQIVPVQQICTNPNTFFYFRCNFTYVTTPATGVYITSPDGQTRTRITPDSWTVNAQSGAPGTFVLDAIPSPDGEQILIPVSKYILADRWFPGGEWHMQLTTREFWVVNADGSGLRQLANLSDQWLNVAGHRAALWSPDGTQIAIILGGGGFNARLFAMNAADGALTLIDAIASGEGTFGGPVWSRDSQQLIYEKQFPTRAFYAARRDGAARVTLALPTDRENFFIDVDRPVWSGDRLAVPAWDAGFERERLWLTSITGEPPQEVEWTTNRRSRLGPLLQAPDGESFVFSDVINEQYGEAAQQLSTGIWRVDRGGVLTRLRPAAAQNRGLHAGGWSRDGRRLSFYEHPVTEFRACTEQLEDGGIGERFCGQYETTLAVFDLREDTIRTVGTSGPSGGMGFGDFFPDGESFIGVRPGGVYQEFFAVGLDSGEERLLLDGSRQVIMSWSDQPHLGFTPSGRYLLYGTFPHGSDPCEAPGKLMDTWALRSLLNLSTDLSFQREQSQLVIRGTAEDRNFVEYQLDAAPAGEPDQWFAIAAPSDIPVINDVLARWIPPAEGTFIVRLTARDKAGNVSTARRRLTWGLTPTITNVMVTPRTFSPDGNGVKDAITIDYVVLRPVNLEFSIVNAQGTTVRTITQAQPTIGPASIAWDGRTDSGAIAADGAYRVRVLDFTFFVTVDTTAPDVRLSLGSSFAIVPRRNACVETPTGRRCTAFEGARVDLPAHRLMGRAVDASLANWVLEMGTGANPAEWTVLSQGSDALLLRDGLHQPVAPVADGIVRTIADPREVVGKRFRLRASDEAGNSTIVATDFAPQEVIVHAWDGVPIPTNEPLEQSRGAHLLAVEHTVRSALHHTRVQYRLEDSAIWIDSAPVAASALRFDLPWNNSITGGGRNYVVRVVVRDVDGIEHASNEFTIHSDLFEFVRVEGRVAFGVASLRESLTDIRLVLVANGDPNIGKAAAAFSDEVNFAIGVADDPALDACSSQNVSARFRGVGEETGRVYYTEPFIVVRRGSPTRSCTETGSGIALILTAKRMFAPECAMPNPERVLIEFIAAGTESHQLAIQDVPDGLFRDVPNPSSPMDLDTSVLEEGTYLVRLTGKLGDRTDTVTARFVVDRAPPTGQITYPASNTLVCPSLSGTRSTLAIEGVVEDPNFDRYEITYGIGDDPSIWFPLFPLTPPEVIASQSPRQGVLANWDVTERAGGTYTLCLKLFDKGGNGECRRVTFTIPSPTPIRDVHAETTLFSPNGDGTLDGTSVGFTLDAPALLAARVFRVVDGQREGIPTRTLMVGAQHLAGANTVLWDGLTDLGATASDGLYHVVLETTSACGSTVAAFAAVTVDTTPPEAHVTSPAAGPASRVLIDVRGSVSDAHFVDYRLEVGESASPTSWTLIRHGRSPQTDALLGQWNNRGEAGEYTLRLTASDTAGNRREALVPVTVLATQPLIIGLGAQPLFFSPNGDGRADASTIEYALAAPSRATIEVLSGETVVATLLSDTERSSGTHTVTWNGVTTGGIPFADGEYAVRITAAAIADAGRTQSELVAIMLDTTPPAVVVNTPPDGGYIHGDVSIAGSVADANIGTYAVSYGTLAMGATIGLDEGGQSRSSYTFGTLRGLADGLYTLRVVVSDLAQNTITLDRTFAIDNESPTVALTAPEPGAVASTIAPVLEVRGSISELNLREWTLRYGAGVDPAAWTTMVEQSTLPAAEQLASIDSSMLADGIYTLSLTAFDRAGTPSEARTQIVVDRTAPVAVIRSPADGAHVIAAPSIRGDALDVNFKTATLEISEGPQATAFAFATLATLDVAVNDGVLFEMPSLPTDGVYTLRLSVEDAAGQRTERLSTFFVDTEPPQPPMNLTASLHSRRDAHLTWTASTDLAVAGYHVYRGATRVTATPMATTSYVDGTLNDGTHRYTVKAVDSSGLESIASNEATVLVDLVAPATIIQSPANNGVVADLVEVRGTASAADFREYRVSIGECARPAELMLVRRSPVPVTSGLLAQIDTAPLAGGAQMTICLEAEDFDGNVGRDQIVVSIDNQPPGTPVLVSAIAGGSDITVTWQPGADTDIAGYLLYNNHLLANVRQFVSGSLARYYLQGTTYADAGLVDAVYEYYVVAVDRAGNFSAPSNAIALTLDARAPRATIIRPGANTKADSPIELEATTPDSDVASIRFQYKAVASPVWIDLGAPDTASPFTAIWDPSTLANGSYQLRAIGTDTHGNTDAAPPVHTLIRADVTAPEPPSNLQAVVTAGTVAVSWTASPSADVARYHVYQRTNGGTPVVVRNQTTTSFSDQFSGAVNLSYYVEALDAGSNRSVPSNIAPAVIYAPFLSVLNACVGEPITLIQGGGATAFSTVTLFLTQGSGSSSTMATTEADADGSFSFANVPLAAGVNVFTAHAVDDAGNQSLLSSALTVSFSEAPSALSGLSASVNGSNVTLTWSPSEHAVAYAVVRNGVAVDTDRHIAGTGSATASSLIHVSIPASNAIDGDTGTFWMSNIGDATPWWQIDFPALVSISQIEIDWFNANFIAPGFEVQRWDGSAWVPVQAFTANTAVNNIVTVDPPIETSRLRIAVGVLPVAAERVAIAEVRVLTPATTVTDRNVATGRHIYTVVPLNACGVEGEPAQLEVSVGDVTAPDAPGNLSALVTSSNVALAWTAVGGADGYHVERRPLNGPWTRLTASPILTASHVDVNVINGAYGYRVLATDTAGNVSAPSNEAEAIVNVTPPAAPVALTLTAPADGAALDLAWSAGGPGALRFAVLRSLIAGGPYEAVTTSPFDTASYRDAGLENGVTYFYVVRAIDLAGNESGPSNEASGTPADTLPPARPVITRPTDAAHPIAVTESVTTIAGSAEPGTTVSLVRDGVVLATASLSSTLETFETEFEPDSAIAFDGTTRYAAFVEWSGQFDSVLAITDAVSRITTTYPEAHDGGDAAFVSPSRVAYLANESLVVFDLESRAIVQTIVLQGEPDALFGSRNGTLAVLVFEPDTGIGQWFRVDLVAGALVPLSAPSQGLVSAAGWSPNADQFAYGVADGTLRLVDVGSGSERNLGQADWQSIAFTPDASRLYFMPNEAGSADLAVYDIATGVIQPLAPEPSPTNNRWSPVLSADGTMLAYAIQTADTFETQVVVRNLTTGTRFVISAQPDDMAWLSDGSLVSVDDEDVWRAIFGHFEFANVGLQPGVNRFSAIATDAAGNASAPADAIVVTLDANQFGDLLIRNDDLFVYPSLPAPGERVRIAATVRNAGAVPVSGATVAFYEINQQGIVSAIGSIQALGTIAAGSHASAALDWTAVAGRSRLLVRADPLAAITEAIETNNTAERTIDVVAPGVPSVRLSVDRASYQPGDTVRIAASAINPAAAADFTLQVTIEDTAGNPGAVVLDRPLNGFSYATHEATPTWHTSASLAGSYLARATLRRSDGFTLSATTPFSIVADERISATLSTDKAIYAVGETAQLSGVVRNLSANVVIADVTASINIRDAAGVTVLQTESLVGTLLLGAQAQVPAAWPTLSPGSYTSTITVRRGAQQLAEAARNFMVAGSVKLSGTLSPSTARAGLGQRVDVVAAAANSGSLHADGTTLRLRLVAAGSPATVRSFTQTVDIAAGAGVTWPLTIDTSGLAIGTYTIFLEAERSGASEALATGTLAMVDEVAPDVQMLAPVSDVVTGSEVTLLVRVVDDASPIVRVELRLDSGAWQPMAPADAAGGTYSHRLGVAALSNGPHSIEIRAVDAAGNDDRTSSVDRNPASRSITIESNAAPVASAGPAQSVQEGATVVLDASASTDADGDSLTYQWTQISGAPVTLNLADPVRPSFVAPEVSHGGDTLVFRLVVNDGTSDSSPSLVTVTVNDLNRPPATADQSLTVSEDDAVSVTIAATDPDAEPLTFEVQSPAHGTVTGTAPNLTYTPAPNYHGADAFTVVVRDPAGLEATAHVSITVAPVNDVPLANAGAAQSVPEGESVVLDGSASTDIDHDSLTYQWMQIEGAPVSLDFTDPLRPVFVAPEVPRNGDTLVFQLRVNDGTADSAPAQVTVGISNVNAAPHAADQSVTVGEDGSVAFTIEATDADDDGLSFEVHAAGHGTVTGTAPSLTYTPAPDYHGADAFDIVVRDPAGLSATAHVSITITPVNDPPIAIAGGDVTANEGDAVTLDGSGSMDPEGGALSYEWTQIAGPAVDLQGAATATATFTAPAGDATLTFGLVVSDGELESARSQVNVTITNVNQPPVADAGVAQRVSAGVLVSLDGTSSYDPDGDGLTYAWTQVAGIPVDVTGAITARPSFMSPIVGAQSVLTFELIVSDGIATATDRVDITVDPANQPPVADAGPDRTVRSGESVVLDGRGSVDPDGAVLAYRWTQVAGTNVALSDAFGAQPTFEAPTVLPPSEILTFELAVNDGVLDSAADRVDIRVLAPEAIECQAVVAAPQLLWPPNHKLVPISFVGFTGSTLTFVEVTQDEPVEGTGDGDTGPDAVVQGNSLLLRAERANSGNGRVYEIRFRLAKGGDVCTGLVQVGVPTSAQATPINDGQSTDSTKTLSSPKKQ